MTSARKQAYFAMVVYELIMGASQPLVKPILSTITSAQFLFFRYLIAAPLVIPLIVRGAKNCRFSLREWLTILFTETLGILNCFILYTGLNYITSAQSSLIVNTRPIFMTIVGVLFLAEREERHEWIGLALSVVGTAFVLLQLFVSHHASSSLSWIGVTMVLCTNIIYTIISALIKKHYGPYDKFAIAGIHMWLGLILFSVYLASTHQIPSLSLLANPTIATAVFFMAILGSVIGIVLSDFAYTKIEASEASLFIYLQPLVYLPLSVLWLKESIAPEQIAGMVLILIGVWWAGRRPSHHKSILKQGMPLLTRLRLVEAPTPRSQPFPHHR